VHTVSCTFIHVPTLMHVLTRSCKLIHIQTTFIPRAYHVHTRVYYVHTVNTRSYKLIHIHVRLFALMHVHTRSQRVLNGHTHSCKLWHAHSTVIYVHTRSWKRFEQTFEGKMQIFQPSVHLKSKIAIWSIVNHDITSACMAIYEHTS